MTSTTRTIHATSTGLTVPAVSAAGDPVAGRVLLQNETITLNAEQIEATRDRLGNSWLDLDADAQRARWGEVKFANGPAREGAVLGADDEGIQYRLGLRAREYAQQISDPAERKAALADVSAKFGAVLNPRAER